MNASSLVKGDMPYLHQTQKSAGTVARALSKAQSQFIESAYIQSRVATCVNEMYKWEQLRRCASQFPLQGQNPIESHNIRIILVLSSPCNLT